MKTIYIISNAINGLFPTSLATVLCKPPYNYIVYKHHPRELVADFFLKPFGNNVFIILWDRYSYPEGWLASLVSMRMQNDILFPLIFVGLEIQLIVEVMGLTNVGIISLYTRFKDFPKYIDDLTNGKKSLIVSEDIMLALIKKIYNAKKRYFLSKK